MTKQNIIIAVLSVAVFTLLINNYSSQIYCNYLITKNYTIKGDTQGTDYLYHGCIKHYLLADVEKTDAKIKESSI